MSLSTASLSTWARWLEGLASEPMRLLWTPGSLEADDIAALRVGAMPEARWPGAPELVRAGLSPPTVLALHSQESCLLLFHAFPPNYALDFNGMFMILTVLLKTHVWRHTCCFDCQVLVCLQGPRRSGAVAPKHPILDASCYLEAV